MPELFCFSPEVILGIYISNGKCGMKQSKIFHIF